MWPFSLMDQDFKNNDPCVFLIELKEVTLEAQISEATLAPLESSCQILVLYVVY